ncbi:uncharacterized protein LOC135390912 isoform X2 [Ornithodoros turicata]|uniref:uncharacterized protein LOC135390912 isoform X2 n=1 Tax=Ornithodoros turicata TaxID=34597 RepID=UPI003138C5D8
MKHGCQSAPSKRNILEEVQWLHVYKWWYGTASVGLQKHVLKCFDIEGQSNINCVNISGSGIVTGHTDGTVVIRNVYGDWRAVTEHGAPITSIAFIDVAGRGPYVDDLATCDHHHVVTSSQDNSIRITSLCHKSETTKEYFGTAVLDVKVSADLLAVSLRLNVLILYKINLHEGTTGDKVSLTRLWSNSFASMGQVWMGFYSNTIHIMGINNKVRKIDVGSRAESVRGVFFHKSPDCDPFTCPVYPTSVAINRGNIFIMTTASQDLCISVDGRHFICYEAGLQIGHVTAVALSGALLAVGLSHGVLNLYHVASASRLTQLDLSAPRWTKTLANDALTSVCISHGCYGAPLVVACTLREVFVLRWEH